MHSIIELDQRSKEDAGTILHSTVAELIAAVTSLLAEATEPELDVDGVMSLVCEHAQRLTGATGAAIEIAENSQMVYRATSGGLIPHLGLRLQQEGSLSGMAMQSGTVQLSSDTEIDPKVNREACRIVGARAMLIVPLKFSGVHIGVLKVISGEAGAFGAEQIQSLQLLTGVLGVVIKRSEDRQRLREEEEWFRTMIEGSTDLFGVLTLEAVYTYCSPSVTEQLGYEIPEIVGRNAFDFIHHDDVQRIHRELGTLLTTPPHQAEMTLRFRHKSGAWRDCDVRIRMVPIRDQEPVLVVASRDVTDAHRIARQMAEADRLVALGQVASAMAHEFNNVLMGIQPHAEVIKRTGGSDRAVASAERIEAAVKRGKSITQQVLRFTRSEAPMRKVVPVGDILRTLQLEIGPLLPATVTLTVEQQGELHVLADAGQIVQTLVNLCLNARDAMPLGGMITVSAAHSQSRQYPFGVLPAAMHDFVAISVRDTGPGIPPELRTRIFEPLFTTRRGEGGSGLGLTVAQHIATGHEGALFVESEPGQGATFHLFLVETSAMPPPSPAPLDHKPLGLRQILIVEDDDLVAHGLELALADSARAITRVATGGAASAAALRVSPELVLIDYGLPDMSGTAVYRLLRAQWPHLPLVFMTGHADGQIVRDEIGTSDFHICYKPFDTANLLEVMRAALASPTTSS